VSPRLELNRENFTIEELLVARNCAPTQEGFIRYLAIEFLYLGDSKSEVCRRCRMNPKTLNRWITRLNTQGLDGLAIKGRSGRPRKIGIDKFKCEYIPLILNEESDCWTALKFHTFLQQEHKEELCYSTLLNYFHENKLSLVRGRPYNIKQDEEQRLEFIKRLKAVDTDKTREIWFCDEVGFEGDPRPRPLWVTKGTKPKIKRSHEHLRFNAP
jgi:transposase